MGSTPLIVAYPAEIWPYQLRARGLALTQMSTYLAIFFNIFVNPIALEAIAWKYYIVFAVILVIITLTVYFFYVSSLPQSNGATRLTNLNNSPKRWVTLSRKWQSSSMASRLPRYPRGP